MVHDFMVTRNHVLFPILPLTGSMRARDERPAARCLGAGERRAYVGVMKRDADVVIDALVQDGSPAMSSIR